MASLNSEGDEVSFQSGCHAWTFLENLGFDFSDKGTVWVKPSLKISNGVILSTEC